MHCRQICIILLNTYETPVIKGSLKKHSKKDNVLVFVAEKT